METKDRYYDAYDMLSRIRQFNLTVGERGAGKAKWEARVASAHGTDKSEVKDNPPSQR